MQNIWLGVTIINNFGTSAVKVWFWKKREKTKHGSFKVAHEKTQTHHKNEQLRIDSF